MCRGLHWWVSESFMYTKAFLWRTATASISLGYSHFWWWSMGRVYLRLSVVVRISWVRWISGISYTCHLRYPQWPMGRMQHHLIPRCSCIVIIIIILLFFLVKTCILTNIFMNSHGVAKTFIRGYTSTEMWGFLYISHHQMTQRKESHTNNLFCASKT